MSNSPAFQFYAQDFLTGTAYMTSEEVGGYIRLLCHEWVSGFIPDDDKKILQLAIFHRRCLVAVREKFFKGEDGNLYNEKLEKIRQKQIDYSNKQKANVMNRYRKEATTVVPENLPNEHQKPTFHSSSSNNSLPKGKELKAAKAVKQKIPLEDRVQKFRGKLLTFRGGLYPDSMLKEFFEYWTEANEAGKMAFEFHKTFEISKRLARWKRNNDNKEKPNQSSKPEQDPMEFLAQMRAKSISA